MHRIPHPPWSRDPWRPILRLPRTSLSDKTVGRILAIANQKGGVGKTTTAVNLAASLAVAEQRTLLIDADPQGNATSGCGISRDDFTVNTYDVLLGEIPIDQALIRGVQFRHLDVLPTTPDLAAVEVELVDAEDRVSRMRNALAGVRDRYDFILIDCPPSLGLITLNMLVAADALLIPLQCEYFALEGLSQLMQTVQRVQESLNPELAVDGVLLTMYDARLNLSRQVAADARGYFGDKVFQTVVPRNIRLAEAPSFGKPIVVYDVASVGAQAYMDVAREMIERRETHTASPNNSASAEGDAA
jgi:chromosome partitioning protein